MNNASPIPKATLAWRGTLPWLLLALGWVLFCFQDTFLSMVVIWARSETFTHGFIVPPISLWLIWRQRRSLAAIAPSPSPWALIPLALAGLGWLLGELASVNALTQLAATSLLVLTVVGLLGARLASMLAFPLAFLFFAVPIGEFIMPRLMEWTADFTVLGLRLTGIPVYREGQNFVIPSGHWSVVEACSGVRYLIASLMVGTLFAYLSFRSWRRRAAYIAFAAAVPIVANWVRAYMIVMIGHLSDNKLAAGVDHLIYGWLFFGVVILLMLGIGARWSDAPVEAADEPLPPAPSPGSPRAALAALWILPAIAWPVAAYWAIESRDAASPPALILPEQLGAWAAQADENDFLPAYDNPPAHLARRYVLDGQEVSLYLAYYRNQTYDQKLVTSTNTLVKSGDPRWILVNAGEETGFLGDQQIRFRMAQLSGTPAASPKKRRVWQCYWINGRFVASDAQAKAYTALSRLLGRGDDSAVLVLSASETAAPAAPVLERFAKEAGAAIETALEQTRERR